MNEPQIRTLVAEILAGIAPEADLSTLRDGEDLREALDLDSMDFLTFLIRLSQRTGFDIHEADAPRLTSLSGVVSYLSPR
jgi:acyl carrier protein